MNTINIIESKTNNVSQIGLDKKKSKELAKKLNTLLANYSIFYQNTRGYHWNLRGTKFFELHLKFEALYTDLSVKMDEIAERILTLGFSAQHNFSDYKSESKIIEKTEVNDGLKAAADILNSLKILVSLQREILSFSTEMKDEGTYALMSENIKAQEKLVWMYSAFLEK